MTEQVDKEQELLSAWIRRAHIALDAHYEAARRYSKMNLLIGIPSILCSAIIATAVLSTLEQEIGVDQRILFALVSLAAGVLTSFQTFFKFEERAQKHRSAGAQYGAVARQLEQLLAAGIDQPKDARMILDSVRERIDEAAVQAPSLPTGIWSRAKQRHIDKGTRSQ